MGISALVAERVMLGQPLVRSLARVEKDYAELTSQHARCTDEENGRHDHGLGLSEK